MSRFTDILMVSPLPDGKNWVIKKDFGYAVGNEESDEVINVPFIVSRAGMIKPGTRVDAMVSWIDIFPTLIDDVCTGRG